VKTTGRPEDASAPNASGFPNIWFESAPKLIDCCAWVTMKLWITGAAAAKFGFPAWSAAMVQVPTAARATVTPETVQTVVVDDAKLTASPEEAVALTVIGGVPNG
jgi:hypothetical protein